MLLDPRHTHVSTTQSAVWCMSSQYEYYMNIFAFFKNNVRKPKRVLYPRSCFCWWMLCVCVCVCCTHAHCLHPGVQVQTCMASLATAAREFLLLIKGDQIISSSFHWFCCSRLNLEICVNQCLCLRGSRSDDISGALKLISEKHFLMLLPSLRLCTVSVTWPV